MADEVVRAANNRDRSNKVRPERKTPRRIKLSEYDAVVKERDDAIAKKEDWKRLCDKIQENTENINNAYEEKIDKLNAQIDDRRLHHFEGVMENLFQCANNKNTQICFSSASARDFLEQLEVYGVVKLTT